MRNSELPALNNATADGSATAPQLSGAPSLLLDLIRFGAAIMVVLGHVSQRHFGTSLPEMAPQAIAAVIVFFVLSGFVIRYVSLTRYGDIRRYTIDRAARIYSVAVPALALTVVLDALSRHFNPDFYNGIWGPFAGHVLGRVALNATFLAQTWHRDYPPMSNDPFWSLSYECMYYALYGAAFYLTGIKRFFGVAMVVALSGLPILYLFPAWLLGCSTYDVYAAGRFTLRNTFPFAGLSAIVLAIDGVRMHEIANFPLLVRHFGRISFVQGSVAIPTALVMLFAAWGVRNVAVNEKRMSIRIIRWFANATFVIYLIHYPLLVLAAAVLPYNRSSWVAPLTIAAGIVLFSAVVAGFTDQLKNLMRRTFLRVWPTAKMPA